MTEKRPVGRPKGSIKPEELKSRKTASLRLKLYPEDKERFKLKGGTAWLESKLREP